MGGGVAVRKRDRQLSAAYVSERRRALKRLAVEAAGGACHVCGYSRCVRALAFHHRDAEQKVFGISRGNTYSLERILAETAKCVLLCANCHAEAHAAEDALTAQRDRAYIASRNAGEAQLDEPALCTREVAGSSPAPGSNFKHARRKGRAR